ncbi:MAG: VRR-NUC domain-containing protein [Acidimicrobiales bacterium]|nr:VRR-NUC domain-containing protein [Acidimicrobiales bacterium]
MGGTVTNLAAHVTERDWSGLVVSLAQLCGWHAYHTLDSRGSGYGWPDLVLARPPELLVVELKSEKGKVTAAQQDWLDRLAGCGVEVAVWRPRDWGEVEARLRRATQPGRHDGHIPDVRGSERHAVMAWETFVAAVVLLAMSIVPAVVWTLWDRVRGDE